MWVAREKNGLLRLYTEKPIRKESGIWYLTDDSDCITIDPSTFPALTWDDEPVEVELVAKSFMNSWRSNHRWEMAALGIKNN